MTRYNFYMCLSNIWCLAFDYCLQFSVELGLFRWCVKLCARWANVCSMPEVVQCHLIWCALCKAFKVVCKVIKVVCKVFKALCKVFEVSSMVVHQVQKAGYGGREWRSAAKDGQNHWASSDVHNDDNDEKYLVQKLLTGKYDQLREAEFSKQKKQNTMEACLMFQTSNGRSSQGVQTWVIEQGRRGRGQSLP